MTIDYNLSHI